MAETQNELDAPRSIDRPLDLAEFIPPPQEVTDRRVIKLGVAAAYAAETAPFGTVQGVELTGMPPGTGHGTGSKGGGNFDDYDTE